MRDSLRNRPIKLPRSSPYRSLTLVVALVLLEAAFLTTVLGPIPRVPPIAVGVVAALAGLYLVLVLAVLPGNRADNRYGTPPKPD